MKTGRFYKGKEIERKTAAFGGQVKSRAEERDGLVLFEGLASVFGNVDRDNEIVDAGAFAKTLAEHREFCVFFGHREAVGKTFSIHETTEGLFVIGGIDPDIEPGQRTLSGLGKKYLRKMSFAFIVHRDYVDKKGIRHLAELELLEVSIVPIPSNTETWANLLAVTPEQPLPLAERGRSFNPVEAAKRVGRFKAAFCGYDPKQPESVDSYQLQIADVIDGELKAVPQAVMAAAVEAMALPEGSGVRSYLAKYYAQMGLDPPWERGEISTDEALATAAGKAAFLMAEGGEVSPETSRHLSETVDTLKALASLAAPSDDTQPAGIEPLLAEMFKTITKSKEWVTSNGS